MFWKKLLLVNLLVCINYYIVVCENNVCTIKNYRRNYLHCLQFIQNLFENKEAFWFGNNFIRSGCRYESYQRYPNFITSREPKCINERPPHEQKSYLSIGSRLFSDNAYSSDRYLNEIEGIFEVQFVSPPDVYYGCNTTGELLSTVVVDVYPGMPAVPAILTRNMPIINPTGCNLTSLCTILFYDAGHSVLHNVWTNWPKENNINDYVRPVHGGLSSNPYVFLAYRQEHEFTYESTKVGSPWAFNVTKFAEQFNLQGPISVNFLDIVTDISVQEVLLDFGLAYNCHSILEEVLNQDKNTIGVDLGLGHLSLNSWLAVEYQNSKYFNSTSCIDENKIIDKVTWIDSVRNGIVQPDEVRNKPSIYLISGLYYFPSVDDFKDKLFTLLMVRFDFVLPNEMNDVHVFVHWALINVANGNFTTGSEIRSYLEPLPSTTLSDQYYVLLLKQNGTLRFPSFEKYFDDAKCSPCHFSSNSCNQQIFDKRCGLPLNRFMKESGLDLHALARFRLPEYAQLTPYMKCVSKKYGFQNDIN